MNKLYLGTTFVELEKDLSISEQDGCSKFVQRVREFRTAMENGGIVMGSLAEIEQVFSQTEVESVFEGGYYLLLSNEESFFTLVNEGRLGKQVKTTSEAWSMLMWDLANDIDTLHQYGSNGTDDNAELLKNILLLFASTTVSCNPSDIWFLQEPC